MLHFFGYSMLEAHFPMRGTRRHFLEWVSSLEYPANHRLENQHGRCSHRSPGHRSRNFSLRGFRWTWRYSFPGKQPITRPLPFDLGSLGTEVSKYSKKKFGEELKKNKNFINGNYKTALEETCMKIDQLLDTQEGRSEVFRLREGGGSSSSEITAGCTANIVLITKDKIICANAGDSRSVIYSNGSATALSKDHKPDDPIEYDRIQKAGGYVVDGRVNGNLNLSRALGDLEYKRVKGKTPKEQLISAFPDVTERRRDPKDEFIIMGCDGIWETETNDQICQFIKQKMPGSLSLTSIVNGLLDSLLARDTSSKFALPSFQSFFLFFSGGWVRQHDQHFDQIPELIHL